MKRLRTVVLVLVVLLLVAVLGVWWQGQSLLRAAVEQAGPELTGTPVFAGGVSLNPLSGAAGVDNLVVGNPDGYKTPHAFKVDRLRVRLEPSSLLDQTVIIDEITLDAVDIHYELAVLKSNLGVILAHIQEVAGEGESDRRFVIRKFSMGEARLHLTTGATGTLDDALVVPPLELTDIGQKGAGVTAAEAAQQIMGPLVEHVLQVVAANQGLLDRIKERGGNLGGAIKEGLDRLFQ